MRTVLDIADNLGLQLIERVRASEAEIADNYSSRSAELIVLSKPSPEWWIEALMTSSNILDRQLNKTKSSELNFAALAQLFSGFIILSKDIVADINQLERR